MRYMDLLPGDAIYNAAHADVRLLLSKTRDDESTTLTWLEVRSTGTRRFVTSNVDCDHILSQNDVLLRAQ